VKESWGRFHQHSMYSFSARWAQKRKKDSQVISLFMLLRSMSLKAECKYVGEIDTSFQWVPAFQIGIHSNVVVRGSILKNFKALYCLKKHLRVLWYWALGSISLIFKEQLLLAQIPKRQKRLTTKSLKVALRTLMKLTPADHGKNNSTTIMNKSKK